jgi:Ni/Co efflux regulator RcnB
MNAIFAALAGAALIFGATQAQGAAQEHGSRPGVLPPPGPQIGGPNRHSSPGIMPNRLEMNRNGELEEVGPNRHDGDASHFGGPANSDRLRGNFTAGHRFHAPAWSPPPGTQYRRWTAGEHLPPLYYGSGQWITQFNLYGLTTPPPNTVWVRSGPDALLVNRTSGEIERAQYGVFE